MGINTSTNQQNSHFSILGLREPVCPQPVRPPSLTAHQMARRQIHHCLCEECHVRPPILAPERGASGCYRASLVPGIVGMCRMLQMLLICRLMYLVATCVGE